MQDIIEYLDNKHITYERQGNEVLITCPYCGKQKLSINILTSVFQCWVCKAQNPASPYVRGHVSQLQKEWGDIVEISPISVPPVNDEVDFTHKADQYAKDILNSKRAIKYLAKRGFDLDDIKKFKLGYTIRRNEEWISIPIYENGICKFIKYRNITSVSKRKNKKYDREKGGKSLLYNHEALKEYNVINILEGEIDALTLIKNGYENTVGITVGAGTLKEEWYEQLILKDRIYLCFDSDKAGQIAAKEVWATRLGLAKCYNVELPENYDVNDYFLENSKEDFDELISQAKQFKISGIVSLQDALFEAYRRSVNEDVEQKFELPWQNVNRLLGGGLVRKRLTVLSGFPGVGKTSFSMQIAYHFAMKYKMPSLIFCLEMSEFMLATKVIQLHCDLVIDEVNVSEAVLYAQELSGIPIYLGYSSRITSSVFYNTMVEVRNRYGVQFGIFDNLHRMIRSDVESEMGKASGMFKDLVMDLNIPFLLVCQPRKRGTDTPNNYMPIYDDIKGSSAIPADADEVILLHRKRISDDTGVNALEPKATVIIDKSRFASGGRTNLHFIGEKSKFVEDNA